MQPIIRSFIQKHTPPVLSILISIAASTFYLGQVVTDGFYAMKADIITEARQPFYLATEYSLKKQLEKLDRDPDDLKTTDIELLSIQCNSDFGLSYVPILPPNRKISAQNTCSKLTSLYVDRASY